MAESRNMARFALRGVGDRDAGEWEEIGAQGVFHLRRRLTEAEAVGLGVRDIRGTSEVRARVAALVADCPLAAQVIEQQGGVV